MTFVLADVSSMYGLLMVVVFFFFFQAEDGIRDLTVTGVQTCALPICFLATPGARSRESCSRNPCAAGITSKLASRRPFAEHQPAKVARSGGRFSMSLVSWACRNARASPPVTESRP